jgi:hypothetical protein
MVKIGNAIDKRLKITNITNVVITETIDFGKME